MKYRPSTRPFLGCLLVFAAMLVASSSMANETTQYDSMVPYSADLETRVHRLTGGSVFHGIDVTLTYTPPAEENDLFLFPAFAIEGLSTVSERGASPLAMFANRAIVLETSTLTALRFHILDYNQRNDFVRDAQKTLAADNIAATGKPVRSPRFDQNTPWSVRLVDDYTGELLGEGTLTRRPERFRNRVDIELNSQGKQRFAEGIAPSDLALEISGGYDAKFRELEVEASVSLVGESAVALGEAMSGGSGQLNPEFLVALGGTVQRRSQLASFVKNYFNLQIAYRQDARGEVIDMLVEKLLDAAVKTVNVGALPPETIVSFVTSSGLQLTMAVGDVTEMVKHVRTEDESKLREVLDTTDHAVYSVSGGLEDVFNVATSSNTTSEYMHETEEFRRDVDDINRIIQGELSSVAAVNIENLATAANELASQWQGSISEFTNGRADYQVFLRIDKLVHSNAFIWGGDAPGTVKLWAGETPPENWAICNGDGLSRVAYPALFEAIGYLHGGEDETFNLPDLRGVFVRGVDDGRGKDPDAHNRKDVDGKLYEGVGSIQEDATARPNNRFKTAEGGEHTHEILAYKGNGTGAARPLGHGDGGSAYQHTAKEPGSAHSHTISGGGDKETRPANVALHYIIKLR